MSRFEICVTIIDTPEEQSIGDAAAEEDVFHEDENGNDPMSGKEESTLSESEFLYGYFDESLFEEPIPQQPPPPNAKKTRIIQTDIDAKQEILGCLRDFVIEDDIVQIEMDEDNQIRFIVDMSSEECVLLNLASSTPYMTINDVPDTSHE